MNEEGKPQPSAEELLKATAQNVSELASMATHQIEESLNRSRMRLAEMQAILKDRSRECVRTTDRYIHDKPWNAVAMAAGIGFILGLILRRR